MRERPLSRECRAGRSLDVPLPLPLPLYRSTPLHWQLPGSYYYRILWCILHTPGPIFHARYLHSRKSVGVKTRRRLKHLAEGFPKTYRSVLAPSWLSSNRAWKNRPRGLWYTPSSYTLRALLWVTGSCSTCQLVGPAIRDV